MKKNTHYDERCQMAACFRAAAIFGMHESIANHFSLNLGDDQILLNPPRYFPLIKASDLMVVNVRDSDSPQKIKNLDPTAWALHGAIHRECPHVKAAFHVHSIHATVLASLENNQLLPIDQNSAMFFERVVIDNNYGGLAFEDEGARVARTLRENPKARVLIMANHGIMVVGKSVAQALLYLYYFERAAETLVRAYQSGQKLNILSDDIARKTADEQDNYGNFDQVFLENMMEYCDQHQGDFRN